MNQRASSSQECDLCDESESDELVFAIVAWDPITDESVDDGEVLVFCKEHLSELVEGDKCYVRELAPIPEKRGGFQRTSDSEGRDILYDHDVSEDAWIRFDPDIDESELR